MSERPQLTEYAEGFGGVLGVYWVSLSIFGRVGVWSITASNQKKIV